MLLRPHVLVDQVRLRHSFVLESPGLWFQLLVWIVDESIVLREEHAVRIRLGLRWRELRGIERHVLLLQLNVRRIECVRTSRMDWAQHTCSLNLR